MQKTGDSLVKLIAGAFIAIGIAMFFTYLIYLPAPSLFAASGTDHLGLLMYSGATAGAAFIAWGLMLFGLDETGLTKVKVLKATGIGIGLLALMRLMVAIFPHAPFDEILYVPIGECVLFSLLAFKFFRY